MISGFGSGQTRARWLQQFLTAQLSSSTTVRPPQRQVSYPPTSFTRAFVRTRFAVEKTGGTTLRAILQRHAQQGIFDIFSFINRQDRLQLQIILHRIHTLAREKTLSGLRLAVEIHVGADHTFPFFFKHTLPDLLHTRSLLRAAGCRCNLVSLLRHPLLQHLSWQ